MEKVGKEKVIVMGRAGKGERSRILGRAWREREFNVNLRSEESRGSHDTIIIIIVIIIIMRILMGRGEVRLGEDSGRRRRRRKFFKGESITWS